MRHSWTKPAASVRWRHNRSADDDIFLHAGKIKDPEVRKSENVAVLCIGKYEPFPEWLWKGSDRWLSTANIIGNMENMCSSCKRMYNVLNTLVDHYWMTKLTKMKRFLNEFERKTRRKPENRKFAQKSTRNLRTTGR